MGREREIKLYTIETKTNPGPRRGWRGRNKTDEKRERRREKRKERRKTRGQKEEMKKGEMKVVTWNLQTMSLRENNRRRLRRVIGYVEKKGWQVVLGTDNRDKSRNSRHTTAGRTGKSGGNSTWKEDGGGVERSSPERVDGGWPNQKICRKNNKSGNRRGKTGSCVPTLVGQRPGGSGELQDGGGAEVGHGKKRTDHGDKGDHNAQVGRGAEVEGTRGKYGMNTPTNEAGDDLVN